MRNQYEENGPYTYRIWLNDTQYAIISKGDLEKVSSYNHWYITSNGAVSYESGKQVLLHRVILNAKHGEVVIHKSGNNLNCQRSNMILVKHDDRWYHYDKDRESKGQVKYKGVYFDKTAQKYKAQIRLPGGKKKHLGYYTIPEQAALAYADAIEKHRPKHTPTKKRTCLYEGCERVISARGYCATHYTQMTTAGKPYKPTVDVVYKSYIGKTIGNIRVMSLDKERNDYKRQTFRCKCIHCGRESHKTKWVLKLYNTCACKQSKGKHHE